MKASELIAELQKAIAEHGDLEVTFENDSLGVSTITAVDKYGPMADGATFLVISA